MSSDTDFQATVREMWQTRPARPRDDRKIAGVAAAIARRYDIDPVLVRIGFVVAAFYGIGILLYIAGWIALPDESATAPSRAGDGGREVRRRGPHPALIIALAIAGIITVGTLVTGEPEGLFALAVVGGLLFLLHRHRADQGQPGGTSPVGPAGPAAADDDAASGPAGASGEEPTEERPAGEPGQRTEPRAWDPLGAAPFAWDLPEPSPPPPPAPPSPRSRVTLVTLGLALLAGGITGGILLAGGDLGALRIQFGVVLGVTGLGLVVGAFRQGGRGLILLAVPLMFLTYAATAAPLTSWRGAGELTATPVVAADVAPRYERSVGDIQLDLRDLDLSTPAGADAAPIVTTVDVGLGNAEVYLPPDADVQLHCSVSIGDAACASLGDGDRRGPSVDVRGTDLGRDGREGGRLIVLDAHAGMGNVEVHRG